MDEEKFELPEKLLLLMHNFGIVRPELAKTGSELSQILQINIVDVSPILATHELEGYIKSFIDPTGVKRYYLTGNGILKVCSTFT
jgi:hypothetical protein